MKIEYDKESKEIVWSMNMREYAAITASSQNMAEILESKHRDFDFLNSLHDHTTKAISSLCPVYTSYYRENNQ